MLNLSIQLGKFLSVTAVHADDRYISILDHQHTLFLIPVYPSGSLQITGAIGPPNMPHDGAIHLDHLELRDVSLISITPRRLLIETSHGLQLQWKVHLHEVFQPQALAG